MVSNVRELRPWHPEGFCPFCPGTPETGHGWDVLILNNKYPILSEEPPKLRPHKFFKNAPSYGKNYIVVETPKHDLDDLSDLTVEEIRKVITYVIDKYIEELSDKRSVYFLYFRNKGKEVGVSLTHPHSQIYVLPFIPTKVRRELTNALNHFKRYGRCLFCDLIDAEVSDKERIILKSSHWIAFIPYYAHWPFEVHIYPLKHINTLNQVNEVMAEDLAYVLKKVLCGVKNIFENPMPYTMVLHQAPMRGHYSYYHLHIEIYGMYRTSGRLKYAAGVESGAGNFTYDDTPEEAASILRDTIERKCVIQ